MTGIAAKLNNDNTVSATHKLLVCVITGLRKLTDQRHSSLISD